MGPIISHRSRRLLAGAALGALTAATPALAQDTVRIGSRVAGELSTRDDQLDTGEYLDTYLFQGRAGDRLSVRMSSSEIDPYLMIRGPRGFSEDNDDAAPGDLDAALDVRLPASGAYQIVATSYAAGERGRYTLVVGDRPGEPDRGPSPGPNAGGGWLTPGERANGSLQPGDDTLPSGEYADTWRVRVRAGERYVATMRSADLDSYLMVRGMGLQADNDDDPTSRGGVHSRLEFTAPDDGELQLVATSYRAGERGGYVLSLEPAGGDRRDGRRPAPDSSTGGTLAVGDRINGRLGAGDRQLRSGEYINTYSLRGRRGDQIELTLTSPDFDPYLMVTGPGGFSMQNDDDPEGESLDSRLFMTLPQDGVYEVTATSYAAGETGAYTLGARRASGAAPTPTPPSTGPGGDVLQLGVSRRGALQRGDGTLSSGEYVDTYTYMGRRGERVAIEATSSEFDTYLMLVQPDDEQIDNDDAEDTTDSRIDTVLPLDGEYTVQVTSYAPGETGAYEVTVRPSFGTPR